MTNHVVVKVFHQIGGSEVRQRIILRIWYMAVDKFIDFSDINQV
ncbi:hypothetical protein RV03_GL003528 [Enterococcus gallinarum]|nr:hypothetical protein RV03_GL003528 [Enterococcus gallinarum]